MLVPDHRSFQSQDLSIYISGQGYQENLPAARRNLMLLDFTGSLASLDSCLECDRHCRKPLNQKPSLKCGYIFRAIRAAISSKPFRISLRLPAVLFLFLGIYGNLEHNFQHLRPRITISGYWSGNP